MYVISFKKKSESRIEEDSGYAAYRDFLEIQSIEDTLQSDPLYNKRIRVGLRYQALGPFIYRLYGKYGEFPASFSKKTANFLTGYLPDHIWPDNMVKTGRVKREYIMDRVAEEAFDVRGNSGADLDQIIDHINRLIKLKSRLDYLKRTAE
jgi:hypothetical protein